MKKRLISLALTLALCLGLAIPVMAAGSYGPYTITGTSYGRAFTVTFSAAKTERRTIQIREHGDIGNTYSAYQKKTVTYVTIRPDTKVTALSGDYPMVSVAGVSADGDGRYTQIVMGAPETIENGTGWDAFVTEFPLVYLYSDTGEYLITMDPSATPSGFTDVKAGAYYADAVKWAVDRKITSGTSDTTFSPDKTCTVAEILTFLWNANGRPEPTGRNPFSDISSGSYYYKAAVWAADKGLVSGSRLNPGAPCTRAMVVEYLWKLAGSPEVKSSGYNAQTITGIIDGKPCSIEFSAANMKETKVYLAYLDEDTLYDDVPRIDGTYEVVTLVNIRPESRVTIKGVDSLHIFTFIPTYDLGYDSPLLKDKNSFLWSLGGDEWTYCLVGGTYGKNGTYNYLFDLYARDVAVLLDNQLKDRNENRYLLVNGPASISTDLTSFTDVPSSAAYAQAVAWAVEKGVTAGKSDTTFAPDATCTRGEIVTFLYRAMG
ncbi:S-layer homology domain-containing protein [Oscillospiraceae bacterium 50-58]